MAQVAIASTSKSVVVPHKQASSWYIQYDEYYNPLIAGRITVQEYLEVVRSLNKLWDGHSKKRRILFLCSVVVHITNGMIFGTLVYSDFFFYYLPVFFVVLIGMISLSTYLIMRWQRELQHNVQNVLRDANTKLADRKIEWKLFPKWLSIEFDEPQAVTMIQMDSAAPVYYQPPQYSQVLQYQQPPQYPPQYGTYGQPNPSMYPAQAPQYPASERSGLLGGNPS